MTVCKVDIMKLRYKYNTATFGALFGFSTIMKCPPYLDILNSRTLVLLFTADCYKILVKCSTNFFLHSHKNQKHQVAHRNFSPHSCLNLR